MEDKDIEKARKKLEYISADDKERASLEAIKEGLFDQYSSYNIAKKEGIEEGKIEGLKEGEKIGLEKGKIEWLKEGEQIGLEKGKIEIAKNMLNKGLDLNLISELSGLSVDEIEKLKN